MALACFAHQQASHCESGVMSAILRHYGLSLSEPMAFGLSSALTFVFFPFIKLSGLPLVSYRMPPRTIIRGLQKPLRFSMRTETFRRPEHGAARLNELLDAGKVVGLQVSVFWLPFMPQDFRFHFNAHNLLAYGRDKASGDYLLSDPVLEEPVRCAPADLAKARFARGLLAPKGLLYYPGSAPQEPAWERAIPAAIKKTARIMLRIPLPFIGVRGIARIARAFERLPAASDPQAAKLYIGHLVRMQEEIGTGGGGFRFMYAAFLEEAATLVARPAFAELAAQLVEIGDLWREFALAAARMIRDRDPLEPDRLAALLHAQAVREETFFTMLDKAVRLS
ncbi:MAG: BtrH N-terminal domain-containing protein [Betaproteobacteria bacterium]|nr:BtrH N-terminal domain-containing protein [Betaproteobacteria bacterium]